MVALASLLACACGEEESPADGGGSIADGGIAASSDGGEQTGVEVLARTRFTIPAGTVVSEFDFSAEGTAPSANSAAGVLTVAVRDVTHPDRDAAALCRRSHPLDGCATVDYGAFGAVHHNEIRVAGSAGDLRFHLYKDRTIRSAPEALPPEE